MGGWSRASRSRLAALPLRLVGDSIFWNEQHETEENNNEEENAEIQSEEKKSRIEAAGPYFTIRDGIGRQFVCHIYDERELTPKSMSESMFDAPVLRINEGGEPTESASSHHNDDTEDDMEDDARTGTENDSVSDVERKSSIDGHEDENEDENEDAGLAAEPEVEVILTHNLEEYLEGRGIDVVTQLSLDTTKYKYDYQLDTKPILDNLKELKGTCASLHTGWWSYEWCDVDKITQFHVQLQGNELGEVLSVQDLMPEFVLQSISTIGKFTKRTIVIETSNDNFSSDTLFNEKTAAEEGLTVEADMSDLLVIDSFENGEYCEDADTHRKVEVRLRCCSQTEILSSLKKGAMQNTDFFTNSFNKNTDEARAIFVNVQERSVCDYVAHVCTNVLCDTWLDEENTDTELSDLTSNGTVEIQRDDSIRFILEKTLGEQCLKKNEGWWHYRFCYQGAIHQFHESLDIDADRGVMKSTVEAENILGQYDPVASERFPKEDEIHHVLFPQGKRKDSMESGTEIQPSTPISGVDTPCFVQEYTQGDLCEGADVIDSAIKGGEVGEGGIQRATTVRFFCGDTRELIRINEDHTCHYIVDISVPELCSHKYFEIPHIHKHAVKCMPVD